MASISFDKCWFPLPNINYFCLQFSKSSRLKSFDRFRTTLASTTASKTPITAAWMPKEMMSEDSEVLMAVSRLVARVLFEPAPKTSAGVAAMVEVLKPKLYQHFGIVRVPMDYSFFGMNSLS